MKQRRILSWVCPAIFRTQVSWTNDELENKLLALNWHTCVAHTYKLERVRMYADRGITKKATTHTHDRQCSSFTRWHIAVLFDQAKNHRPNSWYRNLLAFGCGVRVGKTTQRFFVRTSRNEHECYMCTSETNSPNDEGELRTSGCARDFSLWIFSEWLVFWWSSLNSTTGKRKQFSNLFVDSKNVRKNCGLLKLGR